MQLVPLHKGKPKGVNLGGGYHNYGTYKGGLQGKHARASAHHGGGSQHGGGSVHAGGPPGVGSQSKFKPPTGVGGHKVGRCKLNPV
jgi:hypothetical protein